jgi:hypothetical protein
MPFQACLTDQFFQDILNGVHQPLDTYKIALYTQAAATDKNAALTTYNTTGELPTVGNYKQGGIALSGFTVGALPGGGAYIDWSTDPAWKNATFSADAAVIYNASRSNKALAVLGFGTTTASNGPITIELPAPGATSIIAIARVPA